jgi:hypothetical protein
MYVDELRQIAVSRAIVLTFKNKTNVKKKFNLFLFYCIWSTVLSLDQIYVFLYRKRNKLKVLLKICTLYSGAVRERPRSVLFYLVYFCDDMPDDGHTAETCCRIKNECFYNLVVAFMFIR